MIHWVLRRMRDGDWKLLPNDKEPGFCFIRHSETRDKAISSKCWDPSSAENDLALSFSKSKLVKTRAAISKTLDGKRVLGFSLQSWMLQEEGLDIPPKARLPDAHTPLETCH